MSLFNEDHDIFRKSVREFVEREITPHALSWEEEGRIPRELFKKAGDLGFLGIRLAPEYGGSGLDFRHTAVFIEEMMRCGSIGVPVSMLAHAEFATRVIDLAGTPEQKDEFVRPAAAGDRIGALGVTEPGAGSDVGAIRTTAVRDGDDYVINGAKTFITNGNIADFVTTAVRTGEPGHRGISVILVPTDTKGFSHGKALKKLGAHASDTAEISFEDCRVPARNLLGTENRGFKLVMSGFEGERLTLAFIICSQMTMMWEEARRYGHERKAFGRPILDFQTWQHRLADTLATIEASKALTHNALGMYIRGERCNKEISIAKLFAAEASVKVAHDCSQIFGGNGCMLEYSVARLRRDTMGFSVGAGTSEVMRDIIARESGLVPDAKG